MSGIYVAPVRNKIYIFLFMALCAGGVKAQSARILRFQAEQAVADKDWYGATQYYQKLYRLDSTNLKLRYAYAEASRLNFDLDMALSLYARVVGPDNGAKYPLGYYWLGMLTKHKEKYKEAKIWFERFKKLNLPNDAVYGYYNTRTEIELGACEMAKTLIKPATKKPVEHLSQSVNTKSSEYAAFEKDSTLYFSSLRMVERKDESTPPSFNKIYKADYKNKKWQKVKSLDTTINKPFYHAANTCFTPDYQRMLISRCKAKNSSEFVCAIYESEQFNNRWRDAKLLPSPVNMAGSSSTQPNFGMVEGKTYLFFSSDRKGGAGGYDIWYCVRNDSGAYGAAINAGTLINTPDDEVTPWFVSDSAQLFFSSPYHAGLGGFDIFKSRFSNGQFQKPENAGYPINSSYNDTYFSLNRGGNKVYVSSNRVGSYFENKVNCCSDIFAVVVDSVKKNVVVPPPPPPPPVDTVRYAKEELKLLVPLTLYFNNDEPEPRTKSITTNKNYETTYREYKNLEDVYVKEYTRGLTGAEKENATLLIHSFFTDSVDQGLDNLHRFADMLKKILVKGETVRITFKGYCSPLASTDYNINLAKRRIVSLRNYFMETENGFFVKYVNNTVQGEGKLYFEEVDIGELPVTKTSDDLKDKRNSVYSPNAASERKIQILAISFQ